MKESKGAADAPDTPKSKSLPVPELYFGIVRALGTPLHSVVDALEESLKQARFSLHPIKVSESLEAIAAVKAVFPKKRNETPYHRFLRFRASGFWLRSKTRLRDAVVLSAVEQLNRRDRDKARKRASGKRGVAYLFRSVHHPKEAERLRKLYDRQLFLISVHSSQENRLQNLTHQLVDGRHPVANDLQELADELIRDEDSYLPADQRYDKTLSGLSQYATDIPKAFQFGDLFLDVNDPHNAEHVDRFVNLIFGEPFCTPTRDEIGMAEAFSAKLESGNLARQVGASVLSEDGELLTTGTNDVPRPGGGTYRSDHYFDFRDYNNDERLRQFRRGFDASDTTRRAILTDLLRRMLVDPEWLRDLDELLRPLLRQENPDADAGSRLAAVLETSVGSADSRQHLLEIVDDLSDSLIASDLIWGSQFFDVLEYGRTMHAEMDAITSAARKGVSLRNATLYCTTLPCHECARLIIGSGIRRVIYIEPYEKSRADAMYSSEICFTTLAESRDFERTMKLNRFDESFRQRLENRERVDFVPYIGVSPRRFHELFSFEDRKMEDQDGVPRRLSGQRAVWTKKTSRIREAIISDSAIRSEARLEDLEAHELDLIDGLRRAIRDISPDISPQQ